MEEEKEGTSEIEEIKEKIFSSLIIRYIFIFFATVLLVLIGYGLGRYIRTSHKAVLSSAPLTSPIPSPSLTPIPTKTPTPTPSPILETTYHTTQGLRYADRDTYENNLSLANTMAEVTSVLTDFFKQYGVTVWTTSDTLPVTTQLSITWSHLSPSDTTDLADTKTFGSWLIDEWSKYPKTWVTLSGVRTVSLTKNLADHGQPDWGESSPIQVIFYQVTPLNSLGVQGEDYLRRLIHHEFDHQIENSLRGGMQLPDSTWSSFNPAGFQYGNTVPNMEHPAPGFVTGYAESSIGEDKAELYSFLFVTADSKKLSTWEQTDTSLREKATYYLNFIKSEDLTLNPSYFAAINQ